MKSAWLQDIYQPYAKTNNQGDSHETLQMHRQNGGTEDLLGLVPKKGAKITRATLFEVAPNRKRFMGKPQHSLFRDDFRRAKKSQGKL